MRPAAEPARRLALGVFERVASLAIIELARAELEPRAMVFAPHADDETLGCGALIAHKRMLAASVSIVVMTDGSRSHLHSIPPDHLRELRAREALLAAHALGVRTQDVELLGFTDGRLAECAAEAAEALRSMLARFQPRQLFIPCAEEPPADHRATRRIVLSAAAAWGDPVDVYEYPVWAWHRWPFTPATAWERRHRLRAVGASIGSMWRLAAEFRWAVPVATVRQRKEAALAAYRTQTQRLAADDQRRGAAASPILADVGDGELLRRLFGTHERFRRYHLGPGRAAGGSL